jgi:hypothetical protein
VTRYEYDAMGNVTKILRGERGDSTSIEYDRHAWRCPVRRCFRRAE